MKTVTNTFKMHVDASLFAFKFEDAQYVDITYQAQKDDKGDIEVVPDISGPMYLLGMIVVKGKWPEFSQQVQAAAKVNAEKKLREHPADYLIGIVTSFAPHI